MYIGEEYSCFRGEGDMISQGRGDMLGETTFPIRMRGTGLEPVKALSYTTLNRTRLPLRHPRTIILR